MATIVTNGMEAVTRAAVLAPGTRDSFSFASKRNPMVNPIQPSPKRKQRTNLPKNRFRQNANAW